MTKVFLTPREAAIRATEKQLSALQTLYTNRDLVEKTGLDSGYVASRLYALENMQSVLNDELSQSNMLPTGVNLETAEAAFVIERLRGLLKDERYELAISEESKLVECCAKLIESDPSLGRKMSREIAQAQQAVSLLRSQQ